jgi:tetratricopeptide (TPR) repeat protein
MKPLQRAIILIVLPLLLRQFSSAEISPGLTAAALPLAEGVPEVAIVRLRALLSKNSSEAELRAVAEQLVEALIEANQPAQALNLLGDARLRDLPATKFWRAQALASLGRPAEALPLYQQAGGIANSPFHIGALFGEAEMLRALDRSDDALQKLSAMFRDPDFGVRAQLRAAELYLDKSDTANARRLLDKMQPKSAADKKQRRFLHGRVEMVLRRPERAIPTFETLLKRPAGASHALVLAALFGIADAHLQLKTPETGDDVLEDFIEHHPQDVNLARVFAKLDELYRAERKPSRAELERWTRDPAQPRRDFAQWYLARLELRAGHRERASQLFGALRRNEQKPATLAPAFLEFAELELEDRHFDQALAILNEARALQPESPILERIDLLAAQTQYRTKRFDAATTVFEQIAHSQSPLAKMSMFNAAMVWLKLGDHNRFAADYKEFAKKGTDEQSQAELRLEEGLLQAANGDRKAAESLQNFLRDFPQDERASEAWIALGELAFHALPPRLDEARKDLAHAAESKPTPSAQERSDYLAIWIEDSDSANGSKVIELAKLFLKRHPTSTSAPDVRLKLAEVYYRQQDFSDAQTEFEILAEQNPTGPWSEKALFFAAESAMSSMGANSLERAIVLFDRVVHLNGELKWAARNEQAAIERKLGKTPDAVVLYDEVLKGDARPAEKREALCGKADIFFEMGSSDPKNYRRASELYDQLAADHDGAAHWRNQALFKKGVCLEKEADRAAALAAFYDVLEEVRRPNVQPELFWFYKAGFIAGRLLEDDAKWQSAAAVYQKLAAVGGARSEEAKQRLDRIRLEHFLWEE